MDNSSSIKDPLTNHNLKIRYMNKTFQNMFKLDYHLSMCYLKESSPQGEVPEKKPDVSFSIAPALEKVPNKIVLEIPKIESEVDINEKKLEFMKIDFDSKSDVEKEENQS